MEFGSLACGLDDAPVGWLVSVCCLCSLIFFSLGRTVLLLSLYPHTHATYSYTIPTATETVGLLQKKKMIIGVKKTDLAQQVCWPSSTREH
jgi:hypothetical protein